MLDAAAWTGLELGAPRASVGALVNLHELLSLHGLRRSSCGVLHTDHKEQQDDPSIRIAPDTAGTPQADGATVPHQLSIVFDAPALQGRSPYQRANAVAQLAFLLLQAAGMQPEEASDDEH